MSLAKYASFQEQRIASKLVSDILAAGYVISVFDGEGFALKRSAKAAEIKEAMCSSEFDSLVIRKADGEKVGSISLIYGNGCDLISDYAGQDHDLLEGLCKGAQAVAEKLER